MARPKLLNAFWCLAAAGLFVTSCTDATERDEAPAREVPAMEKRTAAERAPAPFRPDAASTKTEADTDEQALGPYRRRLAGADPTPEQQEEMRQIVERRMAQQREERDRRQQRAEQLRENETEEEHARRIEQQRLLTAERQRTRFADVGLTAQQEKQIEELPAARRAWMDANREKLEALREQLRTARAEGDSEAVANAKQSLEELRATMPTMRKIIAELTEEQRARLHTSGERNAAP